MRTQSPSWMETRKCACWNSLPMCVPADAPVCFEGGSWHGQHRRIERSGKLCDCTLDGWRCQPAPISRKNADIAGAIPVRLRFDAESKLTSDAEAGLRSVAALILSDRKKRVCVIIPFVEAGATSDAVQAAHRRAIFVHDELVKNGVPPNRLKIAGDELATSPEDVDSTQLRLDP